MRDGQALQLLSAWERGANAARRERGLAILAAADANDRPDRAWPLARIDAALARRRRAWFGPDVAMVATCPGCRTEYELHVDLAELEPTADLSARVSVVHEGMVVEVRPPCHADLAALAHIRSPEALSAALFERCAALDGAPARGLPAEVRAKAAAALANTGHGPRLADLACEACGASWQAVIDIADILWAEIDARARRLLIEVHELATRLHWSERDILALSAARRAFYLGAGR